MLEAERVGGGLERGELLRLPVAHDRQVALGRPQVLADGEHLHALLAQLAEGVDHLLVRLAEADHQAGLGRDLAFTHLQRVAQDAQRALPARAAAGDRVQPRRDLDVVVEDVRALGDHLRQRHLLAAEVGRQALDLAPRRLHADRADHADPRLGAVVGQVVAVDARHHRVAEAHLRHRAGDAQRLERVVEGRLAGLDVAEAAAARAGVAEDHEGRRAALPAVADVRAGGLLADRVQALVADHPVELAVALAARRRDLEPARLAAAERQRVRPEHLQHVHAARVGSRARAHVSRGYPGAPAFRRDGDHRAGGPRGAVLLVLGGQGVDRRLRLDHLGGRRRRAPTRAATSPPRSGRRAGSRGRSRGRCRAARARRVAFGLASTAVTIRPSCSAKHTGHDVRPSGRRDGGEATDAREREALLSDGGRQARHTAPPAAAPCRRPRTGTSSSARSTPAAARRSMNSSSGVAA